MQASMPFVPSAAAQALAQQSAAQLQERRWAAAADRRQLMALTNARRCSMQPLYGEDLLRAVHVDLPIHHVNLIKDKVRQLRLTVILFFLRKVCLQTCPCKRWPDTPAMQDGIRTRTTNSCEGL